MKLTQLFNSLREGRFVGKALLGAAATGLVVFSLPATTVAQEGSAGALLEEIVTTARKRSQAEKAQDVPIAVNAYGAAQIDALFVQKLDDLSYLMPNVQLEAVGTFPGVQNFSIRGQGINSSIPSVDPTVGVFVDGIYMGTTYGVVVDTFDLESLEVLRGPQGLLFGRNVTGGAVLLRNARPDGEFGLKVRVGADEDERTNIAAAIEGGSDTFAAKLVVYRDDDSGYFTNNNQSVPTDPATATFPAPHPLQPFYINPATRSQVGEMETTIVRPSFVFTPNDTVDFTVIWENGQSEGDGAVWTNVTAQRAGAEADFTTTADEIGFTDMEWNNGVLEINIDAWNGTITNLLGYRKVEADSAADIDGRFLPIFAAPGFTDQDQISNELRWSGNFSDGWAATIGLYYFDMDVEYREARYIWLPPPLGPAPAGINLQRALGGDMQADNIGIFWNNDFYLNDTWTFNLGLRYTDESKSAQIITGTCTDNVNFNCTFNSFSGDWQNVTPKVGIQAALGDSSLFYAHYSQGIRSGGFNFRNAKPLVIPPGPTEEEVTNMIEVGFKTDFADGRARFNVAAFHNDVSDMQRELNLPDPDVIVLQGTINAGDVEIQGIEADFVWLPLDNLSLTASLGIQDSEYTSVNPLVGAIETALGQTVLGPDLPRLAPSNYSFGFSWDIPLGNAGLVNLAANHAYRESHPYNDSNSEVFSDQRRTNASLNWFSPSEMWQVSVYGKNLSDEANWGNLTSIAGLWTAGPMQKGRQVGLEVHFRME